MIHGCAPVCANEAITTAPTAQNARVCSYACPHYFQNAIAMDVCRQVHAHARTQRIKDRQFPSRRGQFTCVVTRAAATCAFRFKVTHTASELSARRQHDFFKCFMLPHIACRPSRSLWPCDGSLMRNTKVIDFEKQPRINARDVHLRAFLYNIGSALHMAHTHTCSKLSVRGATRATTIFSVPHTRPSDLGGRMHLTHIRKMYARGARIVGGARATITSHYTRRVCVCVFNSQENALYLRTVHI